MAAGSGSDWAAFGVPFALPRRAPPCRGALGAPGLARAWGPAAPGSCPQLVQNFCQNLFKNSKFFIGWFLNKFQILYNWGCRWARPAWVLVRAGCGLVAGCSPPPRPPVRPPWGGLPCVPPLFPFPVALPTWQTSYPFPPPAGGKPM